MFFMLWILFWVPIFFVLSLILSDLKRNKESKRIFFSDFLKSFILVSMMFFPFFYLSYFSFGNWPLWLFILYLIVTAIWPLFAIYAWGRGKSILERYSLLSTFLLVAVVVLGVSDDFDRWFNLGSIPVELVPVLIFILLALGILGWVLSRILTKETFKSPGTKKRTPEGPFS